jgi:hypothetical protein
MGEEFIFTCREIRTACASSCSTNEPSTLVFPGLLILLFSPHGSVDDEVAGHEQLWIDSILVFNWNVVTIL